MMLKIATLNIRGIQSNKTSIKIEKIQKNITLTSYFYKKHTLQTLNMQHTSQKIGKENGFGHLANIFQKGWGYL